MYIKLNLCFIPHQFNGYKTCGMYKAFDYRVKGLDISPLKFLVSFLFIFNQPKSSKKAHFPISVFFYAF